MTPLKKILLPVTLAFLALACTNTKNQDSMSQDSMDQPAAISLPYTPSYSTSFKIGNPEYARMIVQGSRKSSHVIAVRQGMAKKVKF
jgi:hypothetical protein